PTCQPLGDRPVFVFAVESCKNLHWKCLRRHHSGKRSSSRRRTGKHSASNRTPAPRTPSTCSSAAWMRAFSSFLLVNHAPVFWKFMANQKTILSLPEVLTLVSGKIRRPLDIVLGSPNEVADICANWCDNDTTCYQMDLYQAERLQEILTQRNVQAKVITAPDLWDLSGPFQTVIYPVAEGGERGLKIDMIEQAYHILAPPGQLIVLSPYEKDQFLPLALKKVYKRVHAPAAGAGALFLCHR